MKFSLTGPASPLLNMYAKAAPSGTFIYTLDHWDKIPKDKPIIFICADINRTIAFFKRVTPGELFRGVKSIAIFADLSKPVWQSFGKALLPYIDAYVAADCVDTPLDRDKWIPDVYLPIPTSEWATNKPKPIDLGFYGSVELYDERKNVLDYLTASGLSPVVKGGQESAYTLDFMDALRQTKVTINFSNCNTKNSQSIHHVKGRVWEAAMARTAIIETRNPITSQLFTDQDITWFDKKEESPDLIRSLLNDDKRRNEMTDRMFDKAKNYTDPETFWDRLQ